MYRAVTSLEVKHNSHQNKGPSISIYSQEISYTFPEDQRVEKEKLNPNPYAIMRHKTSMLLLALNRLKTPKYQNQ